MNSSRPNYSGMTINERLFVAGLLEDFDSAVGAGDCKAAIDVLHKIDLDERQAGQTVDAVLAEPSKYGFPRSSRSS
jgi:hypothetical protein